MSGFTFDKPAGSVAPRKRRKHRESHSAITDCAYRGYLIRYNHFSGQWFISKGGQHISYAKSEADARQTVEQLTGTLTD